MISTRRAVLALGSVLVGPPAVVYLAAAGRWPGLLVVATLLVSYWLIEIGLWEMRQRTARRRYWRYEHEMAGPLTGYTPQTEDRLWEDMERHGRWAG